MDLLLGDCVDILSKSKSDCIDMVLTSPPYDNIRTYNSGKEFTFETFKAIADQLARVLKPGGVIVWIVGDATIKGSETGTSFKQALYFKEIGLNLHDTMIYKKNSLSFPEINRYYPCFEYMFIFSRRKPKTVNLIRDRRNINANDTVSGRDRQQNGSLNIMSGAKKRNRIHEIGVRFNVWQFNTGWMKSTKDKIAYQHPAIFPEQLAHDHILSWSNPGDVVLDPMMGAGTVGKVCRKLDRKFVGIEIDEEYFKIAKQRVMMD